MSKSLRPPRLGRRVGTRPSRRAVSSFVVQVEAARMHGCFNCGGFERVQIRVEGVLHIVSCPVCSPLSSYIGGGTTVKKPTTPAKPADGGK